MAGAKVKMLEYMLSHVGEFIPIAKLRQVSGGISDWARQLRTLRQEGWDIEAIRKPSGGYILKSEKKGEGIERGTIDRKTRFMVLERDKSTCQRCGKTVKDGVKLDIDHIIPVEWWDNEEMSCNDMSNLQVLCEPCNEGKKDFVRRQESLVMRKVYAEKSAYGRLKVFFKNSPNADVPFDILQTISQIRDWERTLRYVRSKEKMPIRAFKLDGIWYYRYEH